MQLQGAIDSLGDQPRSVAQRWESSPADPAAPGWVIGRSWAFQGMSLVQQQQKKKIRQLHVGSGSVLFAKWFASACVLQSCPTAREQGPPCVPSLAVPPGPTSARW